MVKEGSEDKKNRNKEKEQKIEEEKLREKIEDEVKKIPSKDIIIQMMVTLVSQTYIKLGLPKEENEKYKNLNEAKIAIDAFSSLLNTLEPHLNENEKKSFQSTLTNLRLNFVSESSS